MIGKTISHYRIIDELGRGGMGVVYKAEDTKLKRNVALKVLLPGTVVTPSARERLIREAQSAAALEHPNICTVFEIGEEDGVSFISMAYLKGESLKERIAGGPLPVGEAIGIALQVAQGLQAAHETGVVHRDIKSANVIIGNDDRATILDFGLAKLSDQTRLTLEEKTVGTVSYMSPEQAQGDEVDQRTDIWSLGVCLYEMLAGRRPFSAENDTALLYQIVNREPAAIVDHRPEVSPALQQVVARALEKDVEQRYQIVDEMIADLKLARIELESGTTSRSPRQPSIAVLPFANMSAEQEQDHFCDGMAEHIINDLSHIQGLRVVARTSSFAFKGRNEDIRDIGRKLGVDCVLEGSVRKAGNRLRIGVQLVNVANGYPVWSDRYERDLEDVFSIQDEIGLNIVEALKVELTDKEKKALKKVPTRDVAAYDFYVRGRQHFHRLGAKNIENARNLFTNAIIKDPGFVRAYCGLADCHSMIRLYYDADETHIENAMTAAQKALELDPELAEAHASYGLAVSLNKQWAEAEREFETAIRLSPKLYEAYYYYARTCRVQGKLEKAVELFDQASRVNPEDYQACLLLADTFKGLGRDEDMLAACQRGLHVAERHLELNPNDSRAWYLGAGALILLGEREKALEWNQRALVLGPSDPAVLYNAACLYANIGHAERCLSCLEKAVDNGFAHREWIENDSDLEPIRSDPRYAALLERI